METLDIIASLVHFKMKYHNIYDEPIAINVELTEAKGIYQALQHD